MKMSKKKKHENNILDQSLYSDLHQHFTGFILCGDSWAVNSLTQLNKVQVLYEANSHQ